MFEIGWHIGLKTIQSNAVKGITITVLFAGISSYCFYQAQKVIPIGTAYAVWSGIGAVGTFCLSILIYGDSATLMHYAGIIFIILGVALLKLA